MRRVCLRTCLLPLLLVVGRTQSGCVTLQSDSGNRIRRVELSSPFPLLAIEANLPYIRLSVSDWRH